MEVVRQRLIAAGCGNPRLLEWLDKLVEESRKEEVALLLEKVKGKKEEFIQDHVLRELLRKGGAEFGKLMVWLSIYRRPVLKEGVKAVAGKLGMTEWEGLLAKGVAFSVVEYYAIDSSYGVTPLLREELEVENKDGEMCHRAGLEYYRWLKEEMEKEEAYDPVLVEELIYHALGCGEEEIAAEEGGDLVKYLIERLAFPESQRVGEWILREKKAGLSSGNDAILLNNLGYLYDTLGDQGKAIGYYEQALAIWEKVYGPGHPRVAIGLNNLGFAYKALGELRKAIGYFEQALAIDEKVYGPEHPDVAIDLNNLGAAYDALGEKEKAIGYYEQALAIWEKVYGPEHPQVAIGLNNLGAAYKALGELRKAIGYFEQALAIGEKVYGPEHPKVAIRLNNLGEAFRTLGEPKKVIGYFEQALAITEKVYGPEHPQVAIGLNNLGGAYDNLGEKENAIRYYVQALAIWEKVYGPEHPQVAIGLHNLGSAYFELGQKDRARPYFEKALAILTHFFGDEHPDSKRVKKWLEKYEI
jgi:tetratricopeptide (TPR) repeat protein